MEVSTVDMENGIVIKLKGKMMLGYEATDFNNAVLNSIEKNNIHHDF